MFQNHSHSTRRVVIEGADRMGIAIARALEERKDRPVLLEVDEQKAEYAASTLKHSNVLRGDATSGPVLDEAAIDKCDLFIAIGNDDQRTLLASLLARRAGAKRVAAVVHAPEYLPILSSLGIDMVLSPRLVIVGEILMRVRRGQVSSVTRLPEVGAELIEMLATPSCPAIKGPIKDLRFPKNAIVGAILRDGVMTVPRGETAILAGDRVLVFALPDAVDGVGRLFTRRA